MYNKGTNDELILNLRYYIILRIKTVLTNDYYVSVELVLFEC